MIFIMVSFRSDQSFKPYNPSGYFVKLFYSGPGHIFPIIRSVSGGAS